MKKVKPLLLVLPLVLFMALLPLHSMSEPLTIIYDSGNTLPIDDYKEAVQPDNDQRKPDFIHKQKGFLPTFPVTTSSMSPSIIESQPYSLPYLQIPFFIIGNDSLSKQWLVQRKAELIHLNAIGMLVEVESLGELNAIRQLGSGLQIYPSSGHSIAAQLNLKHYPALISSQGIEQ